jgi:hypothetical protein
MKFNKIEKNRNPKKTTRTTNLESSRLGLNDKMYKNIECLLAVYVKYIYTYISWFVRPSLYPTYWQTIG